MKELTKEDERLISIQSKEIVHNFIKSYGENPIDYDEVFYNKKQSIGINLISYLKDLAEDILTQNTKPLIDEIAEFRNLFNASQKMLAEYNDKVEQLKSDLKAAESVNEQYRIGLIEIKHSLTESRQKIIEAITNPI